MRREQNRYDESRYGEDRNQPEIGPVCCADKSKKNRRRDRPNVRRVSEAAVFIRRLEYTCLASSQSFIREAIFFANCHGRSAL